MAWSARNRAFWRRPYRLHRTRINAAASFMPGELEHRVAQSRAPAIRAAHGCASTECRGLSGCRSPRPLLVHLAWRARWLGCGSFLRSASVTSIGARDHASNGDPERGRIDLRRPRNVLADEEVKESIGVIQEVKYSPGALQIFRTIVMRKIIGRFPWECRRIGRLSASMATDRRRKRQTGRQIPRGGLGVMTPNIVEADIVCFAVIYPAAKRAYPLFSEAVSTTGITKDILSN